MTIFSKPMWSVAAVIAIGLMSQHAVAETPESLPDYVVAEYGVPPSVPNTPDVSEDVQEALHTVFVDSLANSDWTEVEKSALARIRASGDPRLAWIVTDMMRFTWRKEFDDALAETAATLLGVELRRLKRRHELTDYLIAWDTPSYPGYLAHKAAIYTHFVTGWDHLFEAGDIDWRLVSWGGVLIDDRPFGTTDDVCNCIPAIDNPEVSLARDADWLNDDNIVFGIEVNGEYRAYPRRIMEVREMVNDTLGGRDLGIPYCTLCGAAQAYFTDATGSGHTRPILRTSGLLIRSNKVMYDLNTGSLFDTFLGVAVTGPLAESKVVLPPVTVVTTDWGSWKAAHPETTVLQERYALGRDFNFREGRDAKGPIFPVGDVDPRLAVQEDVVGVISAAGTPIAFQRSKAVAALGNGAEVAADGVHLVLDAGGVRAVDAEGHALPSHEAYWFAWSQFHPETILWQP